MARHLRRRKKRQHFILILIWGRLVCFFGGLLGGVDGRKVRKKEVVFVVGRVGMVDVCVLAYVFMLRGLRGSVVKVGRVPIT